MSALSGRRRRNFALLMLAFLVILIGGWTVYWFILSAELKKGVDDWISDQRMAGMEVEYKHLSLGGYPFRFVLRVDEPHMADPASGYGWSGEKLTLVVQAYNLSHIIGFAPGESLVKLPDGQELTIRPNEKAAVSLKLASDWTPKQFILDLPTIDILQAGKSIASAKSVSLGLRPMPDNAENLQAAFSLENGVFSALPEDMRWLGPDLSEMIVFLEVENFYPLVRGDLSEIGWRVDGNRLKLARGEVIWGPLDLASRADFKIDRNNQPDGVLGIHLEKTEDLIAALEGAGLITDQEKPVIRTIGIVSKNNEFTSVELKDGAVYYLGQKLAEY